VGHGPDMATYLLERLPIDTTVEFFRLFAGERVPKRNVHLTEAIRRRMVLAVAVRLVNPEPHVPSAVYEAVAREYHTSPKTVRHLWTAWMHQGRKRLGDETTDAATDARATRWA
jgi:16S rRNA A1518/A1519 N6-dimethyltransferase RsmA/KsgA/DIM1 with predicted DNA glycosylase/AP lyase activity